MRIDNYEFRKLENRDPEIVAWAKSDTLGDYCYTIAFFEKDREGYDMRTVGNRIVVDDYDKLHALIKYAFRVLEAEFDLLEEYA